jgi:vancomycin resistance protein YoaR
LYDCRLLVGRANLLATFALCSGIGVGAGFGAHHVVPESPLVRGLLIGDRFVPGRGSPEAWLTQRAQAFGSRIVRFRLSDQTFEATLDEVGVRLDVAATIERARGIGHTGPLLTRLREARKARRGEIDVPLVWSIDKPLASAFFERISRAIEQPPVDARLDMAKRIKIPDQPGTALNIDACIEALAAGSHGDEETIDLVLRYTTAKTTYADLVQVDIEKVLSAFETTFTTWGSGAGRAVNIANAASKIDGLVLPPGAIFSFNDVVGPRTRENGFTLAPEIQGDELTPGVGGGTCQLSSTVYAAALFGALEIPHRQSHSRPSSYTKLGLDAAVSYPQVDLKIRNSLLFPIMIHAYFPKPTAIRVEILGGAPVATVEYSYAIRRREDFLRRITVKSYMAPGRRRLHQKGTQGLDVSSFVRTRYYDGRVEERNYFSEYRPFPEVYWVAPGYNPDDLPPLPEHAKGVEGEEAPSSEDDAASAYYPM